MRGRALLEMLGVAPRRTLWSALWPGLGLLGAGALVGAGAVMLLAPGAISARLERDSRTRIRVAPSVSRRMS